MDRLASMGDGARDKVDPKLSDAEFGRQYEPERRLAWMARYSQVPVMRPRNTMSNVQTEAGTRHLTLCGSTSIEPLKNPRLLLGRNTLSGIFAPCTARLAIGSDPSRTAVTIACERVSEKDVP